MSETRPAFLVTGTHSGVGKTTLSFTLMALLERRGFRVQPFKVGPDYIDGGYHRLATGRDSINLDLWMMGWKGLEESFRRHAAQGDVAVIEGMGALYDGKNGTLSGSSAEIAKRLDVPVILIIDIWGSTVTAAAIVEGLLRFDPQVRPAGIILNRAGSQKHFQMVLRAFRPALRRRVLGYLSRDRAREIPERHLGLKTLGENARARETLEATVAAASQTIDISRLIQLLKVHQTDPSPKGLSDPEPGVRIGLARDAAFCFYYRENLDRLRQAGAELVEFSPLKDKKLPTGLDGLYLGGGYPESFPGRLFRNRGLRKEILGKVRGGMPVYAECGGLMYLSRSLRGFDGRTWPMVGALPLAIAMDRRRMTLRYVEIKTTSPTLLGPKGTVARGHEFHYSSILSNGYRGKALYQGVNGGGDRFQEGFAFKNLLASYCHLHFASNPLLPASMVGACRNYGSSRNRD